VVAAVALAVIVADRRLVVRRVLEIAIGFHEIQRRKR